MKGVLAAEREEEDEMARSDDPLALWPDDWAAGAPWHSFASHGDPVGRSFFCCLLTVCHDSASFGPPHYEGRFQATWQLLPLSQLRL